MLEELKSRLKDLSTDPKDPFLRLLRKRAGAEAAARHERPLRNMVLMMPEMLGGLRRWMTDPSASPQVKRLHGFLLSYLYHPGDLLPEAGHGLFGYLDDALLVCLVFRRAAAERRARGLDCRLQSGAEQQVSSWVSHAQEVLPREAEALNGILEELEQGRTRLFEEALGAAR